MPLHDSWIKLVHSYSSYCELIMEGYIVFYVNRQDGHVSLPMHFMSSTNG